MEFYCFIGLLVCCLFQQILEGFVVVIVDLFVVFEIEVIVVLFGGQLYLVQWFLMVNNDFVVVFKVDGQYVVVDFVVDVVIVVLVVQMFFDGYLQVIGQVMEFIVVYNLILFF